MLKCQPVIAEAEGVTSETYMDCPLEGEGEVDWLGRWLMLAGQDNEMGSQLLHGSLHLSIDSDCEDTSERLESPHPEATVLFPVSSANPFALCGTSLI